MGCGQSKSGAEAALEALAWKLEGVDSPERRQKIYHDWTYTNGRYDRELTSMHHKTPLQVIEERFEKKRRQAEEEQAASGSGNDVNAMSLEEIRGALLAKYQTPAV